MNGAQERTPTSPTQTLNAWASGKTARMVSDDTARTVIKDGLDSFQQTARRSGFAAPIHNSTTRVHLLLLFLGYKLKLTKLPRINPPLKIVGSLYSCCRKGIRK